jgi:hypothetical protein
LRLLDLKVYRLNNVLAAVSLSANCASGVSISTVRFKLAPGKRNKNSMLECLKR